MVILLAIPIFGPVIAKKPFPIGKDLGSHTVNAKYCPSGIMGDTGDVSIVRDTKIDHFVYEIKGRGPHEW